MSARPPTLAQWHGSGRSFSFRSHHIFYQPAGRGVPLLLVHGFPTAGWDYYKLWPRLIEAYDVIVPDLLSFGFSAKPHGHAYDVGEQAELCLALAVERCHLLCHDQRRAHGASPARAQARSRRGAPELRQPSAGRAAGAGAGGVAGVRGSVSAPA